MNYNENPKTPVKFTVKVLFIIVLICGGIYFVTKMYKENGDDRFLNKVQEYAKIAKEKLLSEDYMPQAGEAIIVPFSKIDVAKKYRIASDNPDILDQYSYVIVVKTFGDFKDYKYYVAAKDGNNRCLRVTELNKISNSSKNRKENVLPDNECLIIKMDNIEANSKLTGIELGFDIKYYKYE